MADYIKKFEEHDDYILYKEGGTMTLPNVSRCDDEKDIHLNHALIKIPLTFKILSDGVIKFTATDANNTRTLSYSKNDGDWISITSSTAGTEIPVEIGDTVAFKGNNPSGLSYWNGESGNANVEYFNGFTNSTCLFHAYGNIMSLIEPTNFATNYEFKDDTMEQFGRLFRETKICTARHLVLPATTLKIYCYYDMFRLCKHLHSAPLLLSTNLARGCYSQMFTGCGSLTVVQNTLPALTVPVNGYNNMFSTTGLSKAPEIEATTVDGYAFWNMFEGCEKMITGPSILKPTTIGEQSYRGMFKECYNLITPPVIAATTMGTQSCMYMFQNCQSLITPPALPATTLAESCYSGMFNNCWALTSIPALNAAPVKNCYYRMFLNCRALTSVNVGVASTLAEGSYQLMFNGCSNLSNIKCLAEDISATNCLTNWVQGVASSGTFEKNSNVTWPTGNSGTPTNWTVTNYTGILPGEDD